MNAPDSHRRLGRTRKPKRTKAFLAALRRQCRLANRADRRDNWKAFVHLPE
ncbi:MAG: hypothetical protein HYS35_03075 [Betaproteobacteria bacterium]|nr:hypothetical protein [Betaproteobacteria bacterium]